MTLSNFNWTDKDSTRWFIILPTGHEGPFNLNKLLELSKNKRLYSTAKVWAEGLSDPVELAEVLNRSQSFSIGHEALMAKIDVEDELPPPIDHIVEEIKVSKRGGSGPYYLGVAFLISFVVFYYFISLQKSIRLHRLPKMSYQLFDRITSENKFSSWSKELFFKEYSPADHSLIWLVSSSFHSCQIEATFTSIKDRLLTMGDEKVSFRSNGILKNHLVELSTFDFQNGSRIVPGLYEMDLKASVCSWDGILATAMNGFIDPPADYVTRMKVVLFSKGPDEFNRNLDNLLKQKREKKERAKGQEELFWQDLVQKLQTLEAITLQIEQHFLDFLESKGPFKNELRAVVDLYTKKFGSFLTSFVLENENFFKNYAPAGVSNKRDYELLVRLMSKKIGLESMKYIEEFQAMKNVPGPKDKNRAAERVKITFRAIKEELNGKLSEVEKDRQDQP